MPSACISSRTSPINAAIFNTICAIFSANKAPPLNTRPTNTYDNLVNTKDVENFFSKKYGSSLKPVFDLWIRSTNKLQIHLKRTMEGYLVNFDNLDMQLPMQIVTDKGRLTIKVNKKGTLVKSTILPEIDPDIYYLTKIIIE